MEANKQSDLGPFCLQYRQKKAADDKRLYLRAKG